MKGSWRKATAAMLAAQLCVALMPAVALGVPNEGRTGDDVSAVAEADVPAQAQDASDEPTAQSLAMAEPEAAPASDGLAALAGSMSALDVDASTFELSASVHDSQTWVALYAKGGLFDRASAVKFPVWSQAGGQDDLAWYDARHDPDGSWAAAVDVARHACAGIYDVHAYAVVDGNMVGVGSAQFEIAAPTASVSVDGVENGFYRIKVSDISSPSGVSGVMVPSWTADGGQDDIVWHGTDSSDGAWYATVSADTHGGQDGAYESHVYVTGGNGVSACVGAQSVELKCENYIYVTGPIGSGSRTVYVKNPPKPITSMPAWSEDGGQDDLTWYAAAPVGHQLWAATIDCHRFRHAGRVITHAYADGEYVAGMAYDVSQNDVVAPEHRDMLGRVQGLASSTNFLIAADTNRCIVGVYQGSLGNWSPIAYFPCSPGAYGSPSRKGVFTVGDKGYAFGTSAYTCYYYTQYSGNYLFHSILYYPGTRTVKDGRLGMHLSHGCIRLAIDNAKWIYDTIPSGSRVLVY